MFAVVSLHRGVDTSGDDQLDRVSRVGDLDVEQFTLAFGHLRQDVPLADVLVVRLADADADA